MKWTERQVLEKDEWKMGRTDGRQFEVNVTTCVSGELG
jgi:hypothetical protein